MLLQSLLYLYIVYSENMFNDIVSLVKNISLYLFQTEQLVEYMWVRLGDTSLTPPCSPLGPSKSGYLMYKPHRNSSWIPGYIILK